MLFVVAMALAHVSRVHLLGFGAVGRTFVEQWLAIKHRGGFACDAEIVSVRDSKFEVRRDAGLSVPTLRELIDIKHSFKTMDSYIAPGGTLISPTDICSASESFGEGDVLVDCSASVDTAPLLVAAVKNGSSIVLANKKPLADTPYSVFHELVHGGGSSRVRYDATVGAGLPVIGTLQRQLLAGDSIHTDEHYIKGMLSGTLGYVMGGLEQGRPLSKVVMEGKSKGLTEPDVRDDLSGMDVARKAVILARTIGVAAELNEVKVEALYDESTMSQDKMSSDEFEQALSSQDAGMQTRLQQALGQGKVLRYAAEVKNGKVAVGVVEVAQSSALGQLCGTDNLVQISSRWYTERVTAAGEGDGGALVVQGPGAGLEVTAGGVMGDVLEVCGCR